MTEKPNERTFEELIGEFEFPVQGLEKTTPDPTEGLDLDDPNLLNNEGEDNSKGDEGEGDPKPELKDKEPQQKQKEEEEIKEKIKSGSSFKSIALKFIEKGKWSEDLAVEDAEGNTVLVKDLEDIDEETFFQIQEAIQAEEEESKKDKLISIEGVDERRKKLIEIVKEGGDLKQIFQTEEQLDGYLNPFKDLDLDNETVQERIYLNALVKNNNLDIESAQLIVNKAKKDLTLDVKVKDYVEKYTEAFDNYVEGKKKELVENKKKEAETNAQFKKTLQQKYKAYNLNDNLARKLASSAVNKLDDGSFEIDSIYSKKMEDPEEAAELILFLQDKQAYIDFKTQQKVNDTHKQVRKTIKLIPKDKQIKQTDSDGDDNPLNEFAIKVN